MKNNYNKIILLIIIIVVNFILINQSRQLNFNIETAEVIKMIKFVPNLRLFLYNKTNFKENIVNSK